MRLCLRACQIVPFEQVSLQATTKFEVLLGLGLPTHIWKIIPRQPDGSWVPRLSWNSSMSSSLPSLVDLGQKMRCCWKKASECSQRWLFPLYPILTLGSLVRRGLIFSKGLLAKRYQVNSWADGLEPAPATNRLAKWIQIDSEGSFHRFIIRFHQISSVWPCLTCFSRTFFCLSGPESASLPLQPSELVLAHGFGAPPSEPRGSPAGELCPPLAALRSEVLWDFRSGEKWSECWKGWALMPCESRWYCI